MVKTIALNVPLIEGNSRHDEITTAIATTTTKPLASNRFDLKSYPFSNDEFEYLWSRYLDSFEIDDLISFEDDELLNDLISNEEILKFKDQIVHTLEQHQQFLNETDQIKIILENLLSKNEQVSSQTLEFQNKSNQLISQIDNYNNISQDLDNNLKIFLKLDDIVGFLNSTQLDIFNEEFELNLVQLDECLKFVFDPVNKNFKEIEIYQIRFKQCMVRSLTLIRNYVVNNFKNLANELNSSHISSVTLDALIYNKFENDCSKSKKLILEIYSRAERDNEYLGLLNDCYSTYFRIRKPFLSNIVHKYISGYNGLNKSLVHYIQDQIQYFTNLSNKEFQLFKLIFYHDVDDQNEFNYKNINNWLIDLLNPFYQLCKHKITRETNIDRLCELILLLQKYYDYEDDKVENFNFLAFDKLFEPILNDVQEKLIIRINVYIENNIINYKSTGDELTIGRRRKKLLVDDDRESISSFNDTSSMVSTAVGSMIDEDEALDIEAMQDYYTPIVKAIKLLNKIYQLVNNEVFSNLANSIIHLLILSIKENFEKNNIKNYSNLHDLKLYLIKNFIFLTRTIENNFDIAYVGNETNFDFSGLQNLIFGVINKKESTMNTRQQTSFFQKIIDSVPRYVNNIIDGKYELQLELRNIIHLYIDECSAIILAPILGINGNTPRDEITTKFESFKISVPQELHRYQSQIETFINDDLEIVYSLVNGIKENVILKYDEFYDSIKDSVDNELLMDSDSLFYYLNI